MSAYTVSDETEFNTNQVRITVQHPNGGVSEVIVALDGESRLEVFVDPSRSNECLVVVDDVTVSELEAVR